MRDSGREIDESSRRWADARDGRAFSAQTRTPTEEQDVSGFPPQLGSVHRATVQSVRPFGIFVRLEGYSRDGLVHCSQVSEDIELAREDEDEMKVKALEFVARKGETVWVKVVEVKEEPGAKPRIGCSMKAVSQEDGADLDPGGHLAAVGGRGGHRALKEGAPEPNSIHQATVKSIKPYGVFVQLDGWRRNGLVAISQVCEHMGVARDDSDEEKVATIQGVVSLDDRVWVKVVEVTEDDRGPRIGCSMKLVSQADGKDLDPNGLHYKPRGEAPTGSRAPIGQTAGVAHGSKIDWGHLAAGEYQHGDQSRHYDILPDEDEEEPGNTGRAGAAPRRVPSPAMAMAPQGRGRGMTAPAWMTNPQPSSLGAPPEPKGGGSPPKISSVEEALAILERYKKRDKEKKKKRKKHHKEKKERKSKHKSKHKSRRREDSSGSSGSG